MSIPTAGKLGPGRPAKIYEYRGESMTMPQWCERLGVSRGGFRSRLERYGPNDSRTYRPAREWTPMTRGTLDSVEISTESDGLVVAADKRERRERAQCLAAMLESAPELRSHASRVEAQATASVLVGQLGRMSYAEIGEVLGCTGERARQLAVVALKKMKLAGGRELRESWEHVQARTDITWAEATELIAWGLDDDEDE